MNFLQQAGNRRPGSRRGLFPVQLTRDVFRPTLYKINSTNSQLHVADGFDPCSYLRMTVNDTHIPPIRDAKESRAEAVFFFQWTRETLGAGRERACAILPEWQKNTTVYGQMLDRDSLLMHRKLFGLDATY